MIEQADSYPSVVRLHALVEMAGLPAQQNRASRVARDAVAALDALACTFHRVLSDAAPALLAIHNRGGMKSGDSEGAFAEAARDVAQAATAVRVEDFDARYNPDATAARSPGYLGVPFFDPQGEVAGVMGILAEAGRVFDSEDEWWARAAAQMVSVALTCEQIEPRLHRLSLTSAAANTTATDAASDIAIRPRGMSVLVVDDDRAVNKVVTRFLTKSSYTVDSAYDGLEALRIFRPGEHDLVISDIVMPNMNGWELTAALRAQNPRLPIVLVTGYSSNGGGAWNKSFLQKQGVIAVLNKPFDLDFLGNIVEDISRARSRV